MRVLVQPVAGLHASMVHRLPSPQLGAVPATQRPATQVSTPLQAFPSVQVLFVVHGWHPETTVCTQPLVGLQVSAVQMLPSPQSGGVPGTQVVPWQVSVPLHGLPSPQVPVPHGVQPAMGVWRQPLVGLQVSAVQALASLQLGGVPGTHVVPWHTSTPLHGLLSPQVPVPHGVQPGIGVAVQPLAGLQPSVVQALPSLQVSALPGAHRPDVQTSVPLHGFVSAHSLLVVQAWQPAISVLTQPLAGLQVSEVQALPSSQLGAVPARHDPAWQVSLPLHGLPSSHSALAVQEQISLERALSNGSSVRAETEKQYRGPAARPVTVKVMLPSPATAGSPASCGAPYEVVLCRP
jgi:hypothetical protein